MSQRASRPPTVWNFGLQEYGVFERNSVVGHRPPTYEQMEDIFFATSKRGLYRKEAIQPVIKKPRQQDHTKESPAYHSTPKKGEKKRSPSIDKIRKKIKFNNNQHSDDSDFPVSEYCADSDYPVSEYADDSEYTDDSDYAADSEYSNESECSENSKCRKL